MGFFHLLSEAWKSVLNQRIALTIPAACARLRQKFPLVQQIVGRNKQQGLHDLTHLTVEELKLLSQFPHTPEDLREAAEFLYTHVNTRVQEFQKQFVQHKGEALVRFYWVDSYMSNKSAGWKSRGSREASPIVTFAQEKTAITPEGLLCHLQCGRTYTLEAHLSDACHLAVLQLDDTDDMIPPMLLYPINTQQMDTIEPGKTPLFDMHFEETGKARFLVFCSDVPLDKLNANFWMDASKKTKEQPLEQSTKPAEYVFVTAPGVEIFLLCAEIS